MRISDWSSDVCSSDLVAADKRLTIPTIAVASGTSLIFSQVEHHLVDSSPALLAHRFGAGTVHFRLREQSIGIMIAWRRWRGCVAGGKRRPGHFHRSEEHTSELQSLMRISYADFCLKKNKI